MVPVAAIRLRFFRSIHIFLHTDGKHIWRYTVPSRVKVTVSLDSDLVRELSQADRQTGKSRSRLMEEAPEHWRRSRLAQELKEGYQAMAKEDLRMARVPLATQREVVG
jgi:hypothetical protein